MQSIQVYIKSTWYTCNMEQKMHDNVPTMWKTLPTEILIK